MANNLLISTAERNAGMNAIAAAINTGGAGTIQLYTGTQPAGPDTAISTQTLLVTLTFSATSFANAVSGTATANAITSGTIAAGGTATWFRILSGAGTAVIDGSVGTTGCDLNLSNNVLASGNTQSISSFTLTHP